jgi:hypothetical protein
MDAAIESAHSVTAVTDLRAPFAGLAYRLGTGLLIPSMPLLLASFAEAPSMRFAAMQIAEQLLVPVKRLPCSASA